MAIDFPSSPTNGQTLTAAGKTWTWSAPSYVVGNTGPAGGKIFMTPSTVGNSTGNYFETYIPLSGIDIQRTWADSTYQSTAVTGADGTAIGTGYQNTLDIVAQGNTAANSAATYTDTLTVGGYSDWFLPSQDELYQMYIDQVAIGVSFLLSTDYWTSSEASSTNARGLEPEFGDQTSRTKGNLFYVRPIRMFTPEGKWLVVDKVNNASNQIYDVTVLLRMETN